MKKKSLIAAILSIMVVFAFAGCGGSSEPTTLESYFNDHPDEKESLVETIAGEDGQGVITLGCDISENTFTVTGTMTETYPEETLSVLSDSLEGQLDQLKSQMTPAKESMADMTGVNVDDITVKVVYCNGDGAEIWSKEF